MGCQVGEELGGIHGEAAARAPTRPAVRCAAVCRGPLALAPAQRIVTQEEIDAELGRVGE